MCVRVALGDWIRGGVGYGRDGRWDAGCGDDDRPVGR